MSNAKSKTTTAVLYDLRQMSGTDHVGQTAIHAAGEIERLRGLLQDVVDDMTFNVAPSRATMAKIKEALQ